MAPGRKRGVKGPKANTELSLGDLVLAKVKGFPAWPAKISRPEDWDRAPDPKKYFVQFFGTAEIAFVAPADIEAFTSEAKNKLSARCRGKTVKYFAQAVKEICEAFEEMQRKSSRGLRNDADGSSLGIDAPSVGRVEDSAEVDVKDGMARTGTNGETEIRGLGDHGPGLERCSQNQSRMDCQDSKSNIQIKSEDRSSPVTPVKKNKLRDNGAHISKEIGSASSPCISSHVEGEIGGDSTKGNIIIAEDSVVVAPIEGLGTCQNDHVCNIELDGKKDSSLPSLMSVPPKQSDGGKKGLTNGQKEKGSKRKAEDAHELHKDSRSAASAKLNLDTSSDNVDPCKTTENAKDGTQRKNAPGSSVKNSSPDLKPALEIVCGLKAKKLAKGRKQLEVADDRQEDAEGSPEEQAKGKLTGTKKATQIGCAKDDSITNEVSHPAKTNKRAGSGEALQKNRKNISRSAKVLDRKADNTELKRSTPRLKTENHSASTVQAISLSSRIPSDEDALPPTKRQRRVFETMSGSAFTTSDDKTEKSSAALKNDTVSSGKLKSPASHSHTRRRAVRLFDEDDEEEPRTPVHGGSVRKILAPVCVPDHMNNANVQTESFSVVQPSVGDSHGAGGLSKESLPSSELLNESSSPNTEQLVEKRPKKPIAPNISISPRQLELERVSSKESRQNLISPGKSPLSGPAKANRSLLKVSGAGIQKKTQTGSGKALDSISDSLNYSRNQVTTERNKPIYSGERSKGASKSVVKINDLLVTGNTAKHDAFTDGRFEAGRDDKTSSLIDSKIPDSAMSMKHLIAAAQAKRRQAQSQNFSHGNASSLLAPPTDMPRRSPSPALATQPFLSGSSTVLQPDAQEHYPPNTSKVSPSHGPQFPSGNQPVSDEFEETRVSSGNRPPRGSLSGGTEAAVARDAFEGMIETLSRTRESIGRATRLAIDCAKYGIANEVVELLIRKLESEPNFQRKVDLFFLVDSITQCSHSHKGIAGASYIPTVQAALPRLLGAAAPPGAAARENRRQCLKVLRLWLERKILPESLLRRYMDGIGVSNDDASAGFFLRRPTRVERSVDDPIREMEGMLVDEYGSNATFQLPGFLSASVFEEDGEEDLPVSLLKEPGGRSPVEVVPASGEPDTVTSSDRRHCILEDVDGELEMEDVSGHTRDERPLFSNGPIEFTLQQYGSQGVLEALSDSPDNFSPLEGSPPLPRTSPPQTPPLPSSPPPLSPTSPQSPPPLPSSPSPPPPPPPPLPPVPHPLSQLPAGPQPSLLPQPSLPPHPSTLSQSFHPPQSSIPSSSPKLNYQSHVPHEYCSAPSGNQLVQVAANNPHGGHTEAAVRTDIYPQQSSSFSTTGIQNPREPSGFNSSRPLEYGHHDVYCSSQVSQPNQQFQSGNAPILQRPFCPLPPPPPPPPPPPQAPSSHYFYPGPAAQQHSQHPYPRPYSLPSVPDAQRRYVADEQWRIPTSDFNADNQRGLWMSGGRTPSCPGYFRPPLERPPVSNAGFHPPAQNTLPAGASVPGNGVSQVMPSRPDISALGCWRPS
ncbi:ENHANCER OF AG-4 protein 2 isoform X2 [Diospyros lotus]|uniref:ENHANCER OF AG-4 protein 2 isoform X2 n=1 Tax=Diospyros lotus TaxID=55363 RepID=UPI00225B5B7A|nr:ENHANCER OF AG-4 protein 2 isoform X2 [Diospyros lotus]